MRVSVRRTSSIEELKSHHLIAPFASSLEFAVVPDITTDGAFDNVLKDVIGVLHLASPIPKEVIPVDPFSYSKAES